MPAESLRPTRVELTKDTERLSWLASLVGRPVVITGVTSAALMTVERSTDGVRLQASLPTHPLHQPRETLEAITLSGHEVMHVNDTEILICAVRAELMDEIAGRSELTTHAYVFSLDEIRFITEADTPERQ